MANEGSTKPTYEELEAENLRVRGLLQRQWISVEERLPKVGEMVLLYVGGEGQTEIGWRCFDERTHIFQLERTAPQDEPITYEVADGRVTEWMPLPVPPNSPQSSSLVSQGAESVNIWKVKDADEPESADIGKLDAADKSGPRCIPCLAGAHHNRFTECGYSEYRVCPKCGTAWLPKTVEQCPVCSASAIDEQFKGMATDKKYQAVTKELLGSAETGGEKAAPETCEEGFEFFVVHRLHRYGLEFGNRIEDLENFMHDVKTEHRKRLATFRRNSQNQTVSSGVEGAHEGTTADKSVALAESSLSQKCEHRRLNAGVKGTFCADCGEEVKTDKCFRPETILASESSLSPPPRRCSSDRPHPPHTFGGRPMEYCAGVE